MSKKELNPFICLGYIGDEFFCDRDNETEKLSKSLYNGRNVTLISPRKMGKTGLILHTFNRIKKENRDAICIYIDIFPTKNQAEMVQTMGAAIMDEAFSKSRTLGRKALRLLGALCPVLCFDNVTGAPSVTLSVEPSQSETSLKSLFDYIGGLQKEVFIAIDEFQQITTYPEKGTEALLRSYIQFLPNVHFIFSGSKQHLMAEMFLSPRRPFYQSSDMMSLNPLNEDVYYNFANSFFVKKRGRLDREVFRRLYEIFDGYTWYIQCVLNELYGSLRNVTTQDQLNRTILTVVTNKTPQYESLVQFLTGNQFTVLRAIARAEMVEKPTSKDFIKEYHLPGASGTHAALDTLIDKELVYRRNDGYIVYDRFLNLWLRRL